MATKTVKMVTLDGVTMRVLAVTNHPWNGMQELVVLRDGRRTYLPFMKIGSFEIVEVAQATGGQS